MTPSRWVVVGGSGFVGSAVCARLAARGDSVTSVDRLVPPETPYGSVSFQQLDLLLDDISLPDGDVVLVAGTSDPRPRRPWTLAVDNAVTTARLLPALSGRRVILVSSAEVYGAAPGPLREDTTPRLPATWPQLARWAEALMRIAGNPCPPSIGYPIGSSLVDLDPSGRWTYAMSKAVQEILLRNVVPAESLVILRPANLFGCGQERLISKLIRRVWTGREVVLTAETTRTFAPVDELVDAVVADLPEGTYNVGSTVLALDELARRIMALVGREVPTVWVPRPTVDSCGVIDATRLAQHIPSRNFDSELLAIVRQIVNDQAPLFSPPISVVVPPRPERPDVTALRHESALWSGAVKHGNRWTRELTDKLEEVLQLDATRQLVLTSSGTAALRLAVWGTAGAAKPGDAAVIPSYTFPATAEVVVQLGYRPVFCDVDPDTWTLDPSSLATVLERTRGVRLVIAVDAFGAPAAYAEIQGVCAAHDVVVIGDSAPALGSLVAGQPVGSQLAAHAFSMSFAKVVSAGGAGGAVALPASADLTRAPNWLRSSGMPELNAISALDQVTVLDELVERRRAVADVYDRALSAWGVTRQEVRAGDRHSWVHYVIKLPPEIPRLELMRQLERLGVGTKPYYAPLLHRMPELCSRGSVPGRLPVTESLGKRALALPMSSEFTPTVAEQVVTALDRALDGISTRTARGLASPYPRGSTTMASRSRRRSYPNAELGEHRLPRVDDRPRSRANAPSSTATVIPPQVHRADRDLPTVSVVVPTCRRPDMVRRAVAAILNQDYPGSIECLVVFDQCDPEEIDLPIQSTRSLRLLRNAERNPGLAGARNTGILAATGNLIGFCDDDDEWIQGKLAAQVEFLQRNPEANLVGCGIVLRRDGVDIAKDLSSSVVTFDDLLRSRVWELNPCTLLARLDVVREKIGLADEAIPGSYGEDYDWLLRAARLGPIPMIDKPLVRINWHSGSFFQRRWLTIVEALSYLLDKHPEIKGDKPGLARIQGQIAFAYAGYGDRDAALRTALECLRNDWHELRGYLALAVAVHLVSADRVLKTANARGRGI